MLIMSKGQAPKLHGAIVNVPVDANKTYSLLPNTENIIMVKLKKKKLSFRGHVFFKHVRSEEICEALTYQNIIIHYTVIFKLILLSLIVPKRS